QQAIAQDASIVDQAVEAAEVLGDLCDHAADLLFVGDIAQIGTCVTTGALAGRHRCGQAFLVEVDQRQACALGGQMLRHRAAEPLAAAGDDDDLVFQLHGTSILSFVASHARVETVYAASHPEVIRGTPGERTSRQECTTTPARGIPWCALHPFPVDARFSVWLGSALLPGCQRLAAAADQPYRPAHPQSPDRQQVLAAGGRARGGGCAGGRTPDAAGRGAATGRSASRRGRRAALLPLLSRSRRLPPRPRFRFLGAATRALALH